MWSVNGWAATFAIKTGPLDKVLVLLDSAPDRGIPIQLFLEKREFGFDWFGRG